MDDTRTLPEQVACPYNFLYKSYERRWAYYKVATPPASPLHPLVTPYAPLTHDKVITMVVKFLLCAPIIAFPNDPLVQTSASLALMLAFAAITSWTYNPLQPLTTPYNP